jgi:small subunit ribosomal protein S5
MGSSNSINVARATINGLRSLLRPDDVAKRRGLPEEEFVPRGLLRAYNETKKSRTQGR